MRGCTFRVFDNGDVTNCGSETVGLTENDRCERHAEFEIEFHCSEIVRLQREIDQRRLRKDEIQKCLNRCAERN
jgi:hypothetical protein